MATLGYITLHLRAQTPPLEGAHCVILRRNGKTATPCGNLWTDDGRGGVHLQETRSFCTVPKAVSATPVVGTRPRTSALRAIHIAINIFLHSARARRQRVKHLLIELSLPPSHTQGQAVRLTPVDALSLVLEPLLLATIRVTTVQEAVDSSAWPVAVTCTAEILAPPLLTREQLHMLIPGRTPAHRAAALILFSLLEPADAPARDPVREGATTPPFLYARGAPWTASSGVSLAAHEVVPHAPPSAGSEVGGRAHAADAQGPARSELGEKDRFSMASVFADLEAHVSDAWGSIQVRDSALRRL